jgi:hypothetical protein
LKDKREKIVFLTSVYLIRFLPFIILYFLTPHGYQYTFFTGGGDDFYTYLTKIKWGYEGHWLYNDRYTTEHTQSVPIYFFYILLGHIARIIHVTPAEILFVSNMVLSLVLMILLMKFLRNENIYTFIFLYFVFPIASLIPSVNKLFGIKNGFLDILPSVFSTLMFPHYALDYIAIILFFMNYKRGLNFKSVLTGAFSTYILLIVHPFLLALAYSVPLVYTFLFDRNNFKKVLIYVSVVCALGLPYLFVLYKDFYNVYWLLEWRRQAIADRNVIVYLVLMGIPSLIAIVYAVYSIIKKKSDNYFYIVWLAVSLMLAQFMPLTNKNDYLLAVSVPLSVLAGRAFNFNVRLKVPIVILAILLTYPNFLMTFIGYFDYKYDNKPVYDSIYLPCDYLKGFSVLPANAHVLSRKDTGNLVPYYSDSKPFVGHFAETLDYKNKLYTANKFFDGKLTENNINMLIKKYNIDYIVVDKYLYKDRNIKATDFYKIYSSKYMDVYKKAN